MKNAGLLFIALVMTALNTHANTNDSLNEDTVIIEFGDRSKMIIYAESEEDLAMLGDYDINAMIDDINQNVVADSLDSDEVEIDNDGNRYLEKEAESTEAISYYGDDHDYVSVKRNGDSDDDDSDYFRINRNRRKTDGFFEMELGLTNWMDGSAFPDANNEAYAIKPLGSWYVALGGYNETPVAGPLYLKWGGNISWYNWKMEDSSVEIIKNEDQTSFERNSDIKGIKSKLAATYLNASVMPMFKFGSSKRSRNNDDSNYRSYRGKGFRIGAGMYGGYRVNSWTKHVFEEGGNEEKEKENSNYFLNNVRYGVKAQLGYRGMDFFVNYDLNNVFAKGRGPELNGISFGIIF